MAGDKNMKKYFKITVVIFLLVIGVVIVLLRPQKVSKEGFLIRTVESVEYAKDMTKDSNGYYFPAPGEKTVTTYLDESDRALYKLLKPGIMLKVQFDGIYYPLTYNSNLQEIASMIKIVEIKNYEVLKRTE